MPFDANGNYVLSGDPADHMSMAGTGGQGYTQPSRFSSFLNYFTQPQQQGQSQRRTLLGGLAQMGRQQGGGGVLGTIGRVASFLA